MKNTKRNEKDMIMKNFEIHEDPAINYFNAYKVFEEMLTYRVYEVLDKHPKYKRDFVFDYSRAENYLSIFCELITYISELVRNPYGSFRISDSHGRKIVYAGKMDSDNFNYKFDFKLSDFINYKNLEFLYMYLKKEENNVVFSPDNYSKSYEEVFISNNINKNRVNLHLLTKEIIRDSFTELVEDENFEDVRKTKEWVSKFTSYKSFLRIGNYTLELEKLRLQYISEFIFTLIRNESDNYKILFFDFINKLYEFDLESRKNVLRYDSDFIANESGDEVPSDKFAYFEIENYKKTKKFKQQKKLLEKLENDLSKINDIQELEEYTGIIYDDEDDDDFEKIECDDEDIYENELEDEAEEYTDENNNLIEKLYCDDEDIEEDGDVEYTKEDQERDEKKLEEEKKKIIDKFKEKNLKLNDDEFEDEDGNVFKKVIIKYKDLNGYEDYDKLKERNFYYILMNRILNYYKNKDMDIYLNLRMKMVLK